MDNNPKSVRNPVQHLNEHADFITSQPDAGEADKRHKKGGKKGEEQKSPLIYDPKYILQVRDLKKHFPIKDGMLGRVSGYVKAVDGVTFNLERGKTMGLVGESGCGKTTTGRTILRLSGDKTAGDVLFNGQEVYDLTNKEMHDMRTKMQIIFQDPFSSLSPRMPVGEIIGEAVREHNLVSKAEYNDYLDDMERTMATQAANVAADMMFDCENYICFANIIIMLYAVKKAVGSLKTVQKSYQKIIESYNDASDYVDKVGIKKAYEEFKSDFGIDMDFEDFDINLPFDNEEHYKRLGFKLQEIGVRAKRETK